jgi:uncharacterized membrane protein YpjA
MIAESGVAFALVAAVAWGLVLFGSKRYFSEFSSETFLSVAFAVAALWYGVNLVVDYFVPVLGDHPHHTALPVDTGYEVGLGASAHDAAGAAAVVLVVFSIVAAAAIGEAKRRIALDRLRADRR